jgi:hypothetical protein
MVRAFWFLVGFPFVAAQGCEKHSCTDIGCSDGAFFEIKTADGTWPDGAYTLELSAGGVTHTCSMTLPDDLPSGGSIASIPCLPPVGYLGVSLYPITNCTAEGNGNSGGQTCTPIPGHYTLRGSLPGTPSTLGVRVTRDDGLLTEQTLPLTYTTSQPNGPDCEPVCRQASVELELP